MFNVGDLIEKKSGYHFTGMIRSVFTKLNGDVRYVVECTVTGCEGMLHIFSEKDLKHKQTYFSSEDYVTLTPINHDFYK